MKRILALAAALVLVAIAVPAGAADTTSAASTTEPTVESTETPTEATTEPVWVPNTPLTNVYFLCDGEMKEGTYNALVNSQYPSWSEEEPSGSITGGEGCGQVDDGQLGGIRPQTPYEFSAVGYFTGNIDSVTFKMHNIFLGRTRASGASSVDVRMLIDGESVFGLAATENAAGTISTEPAEKRIQLTPQPTGATGAAALYEATITGIDHLLESDNVEHEVVFNITTLEPMNIWAWGNTEAPSGLTFNPTEPAAVTLKSLPREDRTK